MRDKRSNVPTQIGTRGLWSVLPFDDGHSTHPFRTKSGNRNPPLVWNRPWGRMIS